MRFYAIDDVPMSGEDTVFRAAAWTRAVSVVCGFGLAGVMVAVAVGARSWVPLALAAGIVLFTSIFLRLWIKALSRDNWVVRMRPGGLVVRFRSYLNSHFPRQDIVAVELDRADIESFSRHRQRLLTAGSEASDEKDIRKRYLHIVIRPGNELEVMKLRELIAGERARQAPMRGCSRTKYLDYPTSLIEQDGRAVIRVEWMSDHVLITPRLGRALQILSRLAPVLGESAETVDARALKKGDADAESRLIALVEAGEMIAAIKAARALYGMSLAEARDFVESLSGAGSDGDRVQSGHESDPRR